MNRFNRFRAHRLGLAGLLVAFVALVSPLPIGSASPPAAGSYTPTESRNLAIVQAGFDKWKAGTGSPIDSLAPDGSFEVTGNSMIAGVYTNKQDLNARLFGPFNARLIGGLKPTIRNIYADGDTVVAFYDGTATANDGQPYHNTYAWFMQMRDGKIVRVEAFLDSLALNDLWQRVPPRP